MELGVVNEKGQTMSDILDGLAQVRVTFMRENLKPPTVMLLESHEEGMRFLSNIRQSNHWTAVVGSPDLGLLKNGAARYRRRCGPDPNAAGEAAPWGRRKFDGL